MRCCLGGMVPESLERLSRSVGTGSEGELLLCERGWTMSDGGVETGNI